MAKFSEVEKQLMKFLADDRLHVSLSAIRQAMEDIWAPEAPRIVQDFTDHGIRHCERMASFAAKLLEANYGLDLSFEELYLLLAGIYLHDIGMQCDVMRFPEIKAAAEQLGAKFDINFTATLASAYSIDEQKTIRDNHHYLSAAWIDYAARARATMLGPAIATIPEYLIDDLMDVCKYHAKLPITECPSTFMFDPTGRKQLVAALLRFADELDVDRNRVSIETVMNFRLDPQNSLYWWLHSRAAVIFTGPNMILLTIRLHPADMRLYGSLINAAFISEFHAKNWPVLSVLAKNHIPVVMSADSKVIEHDRVDRLPVEIVQALKAMGQKSDPLVELAKEVRMWLCTIRYEISEFCRSDDRTVDMIATLGTSNQRILVRCIGGEIMPADVESLEQTLTRKIPRGWLISDKRVSRRALQRAAEDDALQVFNMSGFLRQTVWAPYFDALTSLVKRDRIPDLYVDPGCYKLEIDRKGHEIDRHSYSSLDKYVDDWLKERGKTHISLLGKFGSGKTWFCRHYGFRQLKSYLDDPVNERLPILITLRDIATTINPQQMISEVLLKHYKLPFAGGAFEAFQELNQRGKLLLILDGFDEMARQVDRETVVDSFWLLSQLVDEPGKVILTSRTEYFRWARESEDIWSGRGVRRHPSILFPPKFEAVHLESFNNDQIREAVVRRLDLADGSVVAEKILGVSNLAEMARKPVMVELLLAALSEVNPDVLNSPAQVYRYATNRLLLRNIESKRTFIAIADKLHFLCELAWEMFTSGRLQIRFSEIPDRIKAYFGKRIKNEEELHMWECDLRNQTVLHRDAAGNYEFAHKSIMEHFVALKIYEDLKTGKTLDMRINDEIALFVSEFATESIYKKSATQLKETQIPRGMVYVPPGPFISGEGKYIRVVNLTKGVFVDKFLVTMRFNTINGGKVG
jgi:hypothetical protein